MRPFRRCLRLAAAFLLALATDASGEPAIPGYDDYAAYRARMTSLADSDLASLAVLGTSAGGREILVLTVSSGPPASKPAVAVVAGVHAPHLAGSEVCLRLARLLVDRAASDPAVAALLERTTFHFLPRVNPDGAEAFFRKPYQEREGNGRATDDDRDGPAGEDPCEDLNGDGWITLLRVADGIGPKLPHPGDPRVMIDAGRRENEAGGWSIHAEGLDSDRDESWNEDGSGGVSFNRNFPHQYPVFQAGAGPHPVSEPESRAVADFLFDHPHVAIVFSFTPEDNLMNPWQPDGGAEGERIKRTLLGADAPYHHFVAKTYREIHGGTEPPAAPDGVGSFSEWAYFQYGRWSFAARGWWIPPVPVAETKPEAPGTAPAADPGPAAGDGKGAGPSPEVEPPAGGATPAPEEPRADTDPPSPPAADPGAGGANATAAAGAAPGAAGTLPPLDPSGRVPPNRPKTDDPRGAEWRNALRWFEREKIDGFIPWTPIAHPDFPGKTVEVGGFKPFILLNPPATELDPLAERHFAFLRRLAALLPDLRIHETRLERLGDGVHRLSARIVNAGYLPTQSAMGRTSGTPDPVWVRLTLPARAVLLAGHARRTLDPLEGSGGTAESTWLFRVEPGAGGTVEIEVGSPCAGSARASVPVE